MIQRALTFDDVLLVPSYCGIRSREEVNTNTQFRQGFGLHIPIISANMDSITEATMARKMSSLGGLGILHRFMTIEENVAAYKTAAEPIYWQHPMKPPGVVIRVEEFPVGVSVGVNEGMERALALYDAGATIFCVDVAHGHSKATSKMIQSLRDSFSSNALIIAGNVATEAGADYLASSGADVIKVGIGPGSVCTTRVKTGFGVPQLTAILNCAKVDRAIIADGGIRSPGDVVKALAAGADAVMLGGMFAGTLETPGEIWYPESLGEPVGPLKKFRGMASREAYEDFWGTMPEFKTAEGVEYNVPARGSVEEVVRDIMGGVRSGMTYTGARNIAELQRRATFVEITSASHIEGLPHAGHRLF